MTPSQRMTYEKVLTTTHMDLFIGSGEIIFASWHGYVSFPDVKEGCYGILEYLKKFNKHLLLNDNTRTLGTWMTSIPWLENEFMPILTEAGLKKLAMIHSIDAIARLSTDRFIEIEMDCEVQAFADFEKASEWISGVSFSPPEEIQLLSMDITGSSRKIDMRDIFFISKHGDKTILYLKEEEITSNDTLTSMMKVLPKTDFMRVHQANIVNIKRISRLKYRSGGHYDAFFEEFGNIYVPVSRDQVKKLKQHMNVKE